MIKKCLQVGKSKGKKCWRGTVDKRIQEFVPEGRDQEPAERRAAEQEGLYRSAYYGSSHRDSG